MNQLRLAKKSYFSSVDHSNPKLFWKACKLMYKQSSTIPVLSTSTLIATSNREKADMLNDYFVANFNTSYPPLDDIGQFACSDTISEDLLCSDEQVFELLASINVSKSCSSDGISGHMLKNTAASIHSSITTLFNLSLKLGVVPLQWKEARVTPVPKISKPSKPEHFRPISLLSILSKLFEKHVHSIICDHLVENNLMSDRQWGFRAGRSTVSALLSTIDDWQVELDNGNDICAVFFDFCKAFDSVPHLPLLEKLIKLHLSPHLVSWIANYLYGRSQNVVVGGEASSLVPVLSGVPQGSVLGPLLFTIYINDITLCSKSAGSVDSLYADDLLLYKPISSSCDLEELQRDILEIERWSAVNYLKFNSSKCKSMIISRKKGNSSASLTLNGCTLEQVTTYKYLGVNISCDLSWSSHIAIICTKARKMLGVLFRHFYRDFDTEMLVRLYVTLVRPRLEYASPVWSPHINKDIKQLESVQRVAIKSFCRAWDSNYLDLLSQFGIPTLERRRMELSLCFLYRVVNSLCYFPEHLVRIRPSLPYNTRSSNRPILVQPFARTNAYLFSYIPYSISVWNSLPVHITQSPSITSFRFHISNLPSLI